MKPNTFRIFPNLLPLAALLLASGLAQAVEPPRVMFVSGLEVQPVLIDLQGNEIPAKKGQVIPPGYSVKVPEGASVQIMTEEKAIVAVRQNSLLKLEKLGNGSDPHKFKLDLGGLRIANSDKKPHKFEIDTPNAKIRFDKGDHEAFYLKEGKLKDGRWGTFVKGIKDDAVLTTKDGDTRVKNGERIYVDGAGKQKPQLIAVLDTKTTFADPAVLSADAPSKFAEKLNQNQDALAKDKAMTPDLSRTLPVVEAKLTVLPEIRPYTPPKEIVLPPRTILPVAPIAGLEPKIASMPDMKTVANLSVIKPVTLDQAIKPEITLQKDLTTGLSVPVLKESTSVSILATTPQTTTKVPLTTITRTPSTISVCVTKCK